MQFRLTIINTRTRVIFLLAIVSMLLAACNTLGSPETEDLTFDGPPEVIISSPLNGDTYREGVGVNILLRVDNAGPDVARIAIQVDGQIIGEAILPNPDGDPSFTVSNGWPATGEGAHTITAVASRSDGSVSQEANVIINVVAAAQVEDNETVDDTNSDSNDSQNSQDDSSSETDDTEEEATATEEPTADTSAQQAATNTAAPQPTAVPPSPVPASSTPSAPQVTIRTGANVRSGPGLIFDPPIGSLAQGATSTILAIDTTGTWYKIQYYNGDGWISSVVADVTGNISTLPREAGPATPIPIPPTAAATATPSSAPDLSVTNVVVSPHPFVCNQSSEIQITIANSGNANSAGTTFVVQDIYNGQEFANTTGVIPELAPGANHTAIVYLTVSNNFAEAHHTRITVDQNGQVAESNESNNVRNEADYVLGAGGC